MFKISFEFVVVTEMNSDIINSVFLVKAIKFDF